MRKLITLTLASSAVVAMACGKEKAPTATAMSADLQRDLKLASATQDIRISPDEIAPTSQPQPALKPKQAPQGPRVIRTQHPTVQASAQPAEAADMPAEVPQVQVVAAAAPAESESPAPDAPPMARPAAIPAQTYPSNGNSPGAGSGGVGGILGGIFGAVIRGGGVGDDDHCDPHGRRGRPVGGDVIYGRPGGTMGLPTGMGGARFPVRPMGRPR